MMELPESFAYAGQVREVLAGKTIQNVEVNSSPHKFAFYSGEPTEYHGKLSGRRFTGAIASGGHLELCFDGISLDFSDGANLRFTGPGEKLPKKHQMLIEFEDFSYLACTVQMYAFMKLFPTGRNDEHYYTVAREKPSPLTDAFDRDYFDRLWAGEAKPKLSVKGFLATEQRIPGLGNGVLQDILFNAHVHPQSACGAISREGQDALYKSIKQTLLEMAVQGGRDTEKDLFGVCGGYKSILSNKTKDSPCPACGGEIVRKAYMGGNVYFCPACQPLQK